MQVGALCAPAGLDVMRQVRETAPVKPSLGVMVTVDVLVLPALIVVSGVVLIAKDGFRTGADVWLL